MFYFPPHISLGTYPLAMLFIYQFNCKYEERKFVDDDSISRKKERTKKNIVRLNVFALNAIDLNSCIEIDENNEKTNIVSEKNFKYP